MQDTVKEMSENLTNKWGSLSKKKKVAISVASGALILSMGISVFMFSKPEMEVLYRNIDIQTIADITEVLDKEKMEYQLEDQGKTILINEKDINRVKILLTKEDIPKGKYTFDDALNNTMSTTETEKNAKLHRLKETDLEVALESIEGISYADVTLVIPKSKNTFIESKTESSASVVLTLEKPLSDKQVQGIIRFISSSVENLSPEKISVIDAEGNSLDGSSKDETFETSKQQELKKEAELDIIKKVENILNLSFDEVRVAPNLVLDFDQYAEVVEAYSPQFEDDPRGIIASEKSQSQSTTNNTNAGEPGTTTNGGTGQTYQIGAGTTGASASESSEIIYVNDKKVSNYTRNLGTVDLEKSSIAVNVIQEKEYHQSIIEKEGTNWEEFKLTTASQSPIEIDERVVQTIANATGIKQVSVQGYEVPIFIDSEPTALEEENKTGLALLGVMAIAGLTAMLFMFMRKKKSEEPEEELSTLEEIANLQEQVFNEEAETGLDEIELKETLEAKVKIDKFVDEKPEAVANLLRNWLSDNEWEE